MLCKFGNFGYESCTGEATTDVVYDDGSAMLFCDECLSVYLGGTVLRFGVDFKLVELEVTK